MVRFVLLAVVMIIVIMEVFTISMIEAGIFVSIFAVNYITPFAIMPVIVPRSLSAGWWVCTPTMLPSSAVVPIVLLVVIILVVILMMTKT